MRSIIQITLLSIVFLTGACTTEPTHVVLEDPSVRGFQSALEQIGPTEGFTQWSKEEVFSTEQIIKEQLFLSENSFKKISIQIYNGWHLNPTTEKFSLYDNEAITQYALESDLVIKDKFVLTEPDYSTHTRVDITTRMFNKGFTEIYQVTTTVENNWTSFKAGGSGIWEKTTPNTIEFYLVKKNANTLQMIAIYYEAPNKYETYGVLDESVLNNIHLSYTL